MDTTTLRHEHEQANKKKGRIISTIVHILLVALIFLPLLKFPDPPPGQEGILISFGEPERGMNSDEAGPSAAVEEVVEEEEPEPPKEEVKPKPEPPKPEPKEEPKKDREVLEDQKSKEIALKKKKEEEAKKKREQEEADQKRREEEAERQRQEEAERKRQEEEARKKAEADALKDQIGDLFKNSGKDKGKGTGGKPGDQGDPSGGESDILEGISTGSGRVGGGLGNRGGKGPMLKGNFSEQGVVVINVCVDPGGKVVSAKFTQKGSTVTNSTQVNMAIANAEKWTFNTGSIDKQCGTITYSFKYN